MARWCVHVNQSPDVYRELTLLERRAFVEAQNQANRAQ